MPNRLIDETSPYLLQHAHNPVDWYPWGDEAIERARTNDMPIFLSIGYSACHWCHVMERESFEDEETAAVLNEHFVCVKVDREERPDVDNIYMEAVQLMTGSGGWPMSVWLTPQLEPFYAGTYFPPEDRYGRPSFLSVLGQLVDVWENDGARVARVTEQVTNRLNELARREGEEPLTREPLMAAFEHYDSSFDEADAGFGSAPKFPPSMAVRLLLHAWSDETAEASTRERALMMSESTLQRMAMGGMYDQLGGGFHRYSTDRRWLVPHFEKMLYDNALLVRAYTEAFRATQEPAYERWVDETVGWLQREMTAEHDGGAPFFATQDADSEGVEGKFFVWTPDEVRAVLGDEADEACAFWDIDEGGNFEGASIPNRLHATGEDALVVPPRARGWREALFEARRERVAPATDEKIVAAWNGLMIGALARAGRVFGRPEWISAAEDAALFVRDVLHSGEHLHRIYKDGRVRFPGYLDDYASVAGAYLDLFETTSKLEWLDAAESLVDQMVEHFWDSDGAGFWYSAEHHRDLIVRQKEGHDGATPASNSSAISVALRLALVLGRHGLRDKADRALRVFMPQMLRVPQSLPEMLQALLLHLDPKEFVTVTPPDEVSLASRLWRQYEPNSVLVDVPVGEEERFAKRLELVAGKTAREGRSTLYACREGVCDAPAFTVD